jgi:VanZ family protein
MQSLRRKLIYWLAPILWAIMIFIFSAQSTLPKIGPQFRNVDKVQHLIIYGFFGALIMHAFRRAHSIRLPLALLLTVVIASAYGATDEWHQYYVPNRSCDVLDWTADTLGGVLAAGIYFAYESRRSTKEAR